MPKPIPCILDTDIGGDIDDTWALLFLLRCPELDLKLVSTNFGDVRYRAALAAKLLQAAGRPEIPVAAGVGDGKPGPWDYQRPWVESFALEKHPGGFRPDGPQAIVDAVMHSPEALTIIAIGTAANLHAALKLRPEIASRCKVAGMFGSIHAGLLGAAGPVAEHNVVQDIPSAQVLFSTPWLERRVTPLDTCGLVMLKGPLYAKLRASKLPSIQALMENYELWSKAGGGGDTERASSSLYDTVAVHLGFSEKYLKMKELGLAVDERGFTKAEKFGLKWRVALEWEDRNGFEEFLVERLLTGA